ncbi:MAG: alpha/beta hydrolase family protein [Microthrixaceae bacterium]
MPLLDQRPVDSSRIGGRLARLALACAALAVALVLAACSGGDTSASGSSSGDEATTSAPAADPVALAATAEGRGAYAVGVRTVEVTGARGRLLPVEIWYPVDPAAAAGLTPATYTFPGLEVPTIDAVVGAPPAPGPFPLVVYSHGSGGLRYVSGFLTEHLASHGFVVVAPDHVGNTAIDEFAGSDDSQEQVAQDRPEDVAAVVAAATSGALGFEDLTPTVDPQRVAVIGHSFGGFTSLVAGSQAGDGEAFSGLDAIVALAPYSETIPDAILQAVETPTLLVSGTSDVTTPIDPNTERPARLVTGRPLIRADLRAAGHQSFTDVCSYQELARTRPDVAPPLVQAIDAYAVEGCSTDLLAIDEAHRVTRRLVTAFLNSELLGEAEYEALLSPSGAAIDPTLDQLTVVG